MEKSIDELIQDLKDKDEFIREEAMGLLEFKSNESVDALIAALNNRSKDIKIGAATILGSIGDEKAIPALIETLRDNNKLVRREASTALTHMGDKAIDPLMGILNDADWKVRGAAAWALGGIKTNRAIPELEKLLDDTSAFVKAGAKWAINNINKNS